MAGDDTQANDDYTKQTLYVSLLAPLDTLPLKELQTCPAYVYAPTHVVLPSYKVFAPAHEVCKYQHNDLLLQDTRKDVPCTIDSDVTETKSVTEASLSPYQKTTVVRASSPFVYL